MSTIDKKYIVKCKPNRIQSIEDLEDLILDLEGEMWGSAERVILLEIGNESLHSQFLITRELDQERAM